MVHWLWPTSVTWRACSAWKPDQVQGLRLKFDDLFQAPRSAWEIAQTLDGDFYARDWTRTHGNLYQAIRMEKTMIGLLLLLIVAVAAFNIISTLVMVVTDKKGDIAILRTLGATPRQIMAIFMVQGTVIGVVGTLIGAVLGILAALNVSSLIAGIERHQAGHPISQCRCLLHRLPALATAGRRRGDGLYRGVAAELLRHPVSSLAKKLL